MEDIQVRVFEEKQLQTWEEFENEATRLLHEADESAGMHWARGWTLFRGQSHAEWHLKTTLERYMGKLGIATYYYILSSIRPQVETFTEKAWSDVNSIEWKDWLEKPGVYAIPEFEFLSYVRHYGFPSPLLDWSMSPYVAAYFAFRETAGSADSVAIFAYTQDVRNTDFLSLNVPTIGVIYDSPRFLKRHYLQQSVYTLCAQLENGTPVFANHEDVFSRQDTYGWSERLTKYVLPSAIRETVLRKLESYNINAYSLIGSEESLLETLFIRQHILKWIDPGMFEIH